LVVKLGIIGYRNHASRLISLLEKKSDCKITYIYHPTKMIDDPRGTNNISDLFSCDAVIIASPNHTHFEYVEKLLLNFNGYIFCEKPPATNLNDLVKLEHLSTENKNRLFFNFNYRFSKLSETIQSSLQSDSLGKIITINILSTHGLAFKKNYAESWRADGEKNLHNILDTVAIHYVDLLSFYFGKPQKISYFPSLMSKNGTSYDTCNLTIQYDTGSFANILNSYASSLINEISIIGTNGILTIRDNLFELRSPRDTFDSNGFFINPPILTKTNFDIESDYQNSLKNALDYFILIVQNKKSMDIQQFEASILSNRIILQLHDDRSL